MRAAVNNMGGAYNYLRQGDISAAGGQALLTPVVGAAGALNDIKNRVVVPAAHAVGEAAKYSTEGVTNFLSGVNQGLSGVQPATPDNSQWSGSSGVIPQTAITAPTVSPVGAPAGIRAPAPSPIVAITSDGRTFTADQLSQGYTHGGVGLALNGGGSYSRVDMSRLPDKAPAAPALSMRSAPGIAPVSAPNLEPQGMNTLSFGELVANGMRANQAKVYANIANNRYLAELQGRGQDITARGQNLTAASKVRGQNLTTASKVRGQNLTAAAAGMRNAIQAGRNAALAPGAKAYGELTQTKATEAKKIAALRDAIINAPDTVTADKLQKALDQRLYTKPNLHFGETSDPFGNKTPYVASVWGGRATYKNLSNATPIDVRVANRLNSLLPAQRRKFIKHFKGEKTMTSQKALNYIEQTF